MTEETNAQIIFLPISTPPLSEISLMLRLLHSVGFLTTAYDYNAFWCFMRGYYTTGLNMFLLHNYNTAH
jgi:hypothetical protein